MQEKKEKCMCAEKQKRKKEEGVCSVQCSVVSGVGTGVLDGPCRLSPQGIVFCIVGTGGLAAARSQNGSCIINAIHYRSAASLPTGEGINVSS